MQENRIKARIRAGQPAYGVSVMVPSPHVVEMVGRLGFDWVLIDCEHGTISVETVEHMVVAAEATGITPIARPWTNSLDAILRLMDRGVMGVQVPHVNSAADAQRAVESVKYYPLGKRGLAAGTRPAHYGLGVSPAEYVEWVNRETLVCVQLEEAEALENIDDILQVEGVDVFFVGPSDLSQSMGYPGQTGVPAVQDAIDRAFATIGAAGKAPGSAGGTEAIVRYLRQGCLYVYTHIPKLLETASAAFFAAVEVGTRGRP
jgi:2-keto-3-deoxy-L-rhamnonate aldolase RhmA